jgi:hypothetical protein
VDWGGRHPLGGFGIRPIGVSDDVSTTESQS